VLHQREGTRQIVLAERASARAEDLKLELFDAWIAGGDDSQATSRVFDRERQLAPRVRCELGHERFWPKRLHRRRATISER
jgi:hypothetical protein